MDTDIDIRCDGCIFLGIERGPDLEYYFVCSYYMQVIENIYNESTPAIRLLECKQEGMKYYLQ